MTRRRRPVSPSSCCYKGDHSNMECMLKKPLELSGWDKRSGFEISHGSGNPSQAMYGDYGWVKSSGHYDVILSKGESWGDLKTVGCGWRKSIGAHCWFSKTKL